jgi:DNA-binding beta-propeller fold protein YncE
MTLLASQFVDLPPYRSGDFDHADVHIGSGRVYVANTATEAVEVIDGEQAKHLTTLTGCPEASGVICAQNENLVFAASRGAGKTLVIDALANRILREVQTGSMPNGLAWDSHRRHLLVADVEDSYARLIDPSSGKLISSIKLAGRPRWCAYSSKRDIFLVNIREPAGVAVLLPENMVQKTFLPISVVGPHGLDIDDEKGLAYVACDGGAVVVLDIGTGREDAVVPIGGGPDVVWLNPDRHRLYCAIGRLGVIEIIDTEKLRVTEKVITEEGAHTFTFDRKRQKLYAFLPKSCRASVYNET